MGKTKAFQQTLWELQRRFGQPALGTASELAELAGIPTGIAALDAALHVGGIARGRLTELVGMPTCGATSLAYQVVANAQAGEATAAYVDLGDTFDPDYAARWGINLERLLLVRPQNSSKALQIAHDMIRDNGLALVVLDSFAQNVLATGKPMQQLSQAVGRSRTALLVLSMTSMGESETFLQTRLRLARHAWAWQLDYVIGYEVEITILKDKGGAREGQTITTAISTQRGRGEGE